MKRSLNAWTTRGRGWPAVTLAALCAFASTSQMPSTAGALSVQDDEDPALVQIIPADQQVVTGSVELGAGHLDLGPVFVDGDWQLMFHDAVQQPAVWRHPDDVALRVGDAGRAAVPSDPQYGFLGAAPGDPVWVVPQTENPGVVWLGWNTQDPEVAERIDRGIRLRLVGADGPGKVSVYLQAGNLSGPQVLWESGTEATDPLWVDVNTHTHANWAFSEPGVYVLRLEAVAVLLDGTGVSDTADIRVAVGDATAPAEARTATFDGIEAASSEASGDDELSTDESGATAAARTDTAAGEGSSSSTALLVVAAVAVLLAGVVVAGVARSAAARRSVERDRSPR